MCAKLSEYNKKRNFAITLEPEGKIESSSQGLKFVVQHHMARREHYDFRLEWGGTLLSWAVPKGPSYNTQDKRLAVMVEDHPLDYRHFEGTIPKGQYGGGTVMLWDEGFWEPYGDVEQGLLKGELKFQLRGRRLKGKWAIIRLKAKEGDERDNWLLIKERDEYVQTNSGISQFNTSIRTGRTMIEIERGEEDKLLSNPFSKVDVMLAKLAHRIPENEEEWLYEMKYDGYRIIALVEANDVRLMTRNGHDYSQRFATIASSLIELAAGRAMILDGEMVITDEMGKTDFQALQNYMKRPSNQQLTYIVFDLLALDGTDLRDLRLVERKERLEKLMEDAPYNLHYSRHIIGHGQDSFHVACQSGMEGIIGKKVDSPYRGSKNGDWIKFKCDRRQEFVIGGYSLSNKKKNGVSSLLLGVYRGEELEYVGRAGTGMSEDDMRMLEGKFERMKRLASPFTHVPQSRKDEKLIWLEPELAAEIKFTEWTKENLLRQASFKGLREDKNPREIRREDELWQQDDLKDDLQDGQQDESQNETWDKLQNEQQDSRQTQTRSTNQEAKKSSRAKASSVVIAGVNITNPNKLLFTDPEITKEDVIRYYEHVSEQMLRYISRRVITSVRCPKGIAGTCFYKKHPDARRKTNFTIPISIGKDKDYFFIENVSGLIYEAQMGTIEFHTWGSNVDQLERPDIMVFDLDPDEDMDLSRIRQGARDVRSILAELSLSSYLKTSGGKGYHVVVPFHSSNMTWDMFNQFAKRVAQVMEQQWPDRYTSNVRKSSRMGKIFIDWIRNGRGATSVAPYSIRARKGAKVSMPISWDELDIVAPDGINMMDALSRISGYDPWNDFFVKK